MFGQTLIKVNPNQLKWVVKFVQKRNLPPPVLTGKEESSFGEREGGGGGQKSIFIAIEKIMPVITKINWTSRRWNCYSLNNIWNSDVCIWFFSKVIYEIFHRRSSIWCLRKIFQETNISYPLLRTRNDWNISFSENFCVHTKCMIPHL